MATITKTLTGQVQGVSVSPTGQIFTSVEWVDNTSPAAPVAPTRPGQPPLPGAGRARPMGRTQIRIEGDKVFANNVEIGTVAGGTSASAVNLTSTIKASLEALIASGKISL